LNKKPKWAYTIVIKNCKKGTGAWFHEKRHEWQERKYGLISFFGFTDYLTLTLLGVSLYWQAYFYSTVIFSLYVLPIFLLELDAEYYAVRKKGFINYYLKHA